MRAIAYKPRIGQGRAGVRGEMRVELPSQPRQIPVPVTEPMHEVAAQLQVASEHESPAQTDFRQPIDPRTEARQVPIYPDPLLRLPPRLPDLKVNRKGVMDLDMGINNDFEENSPFQEVIISETYDRLDRSYIKEPLGLTDLLDTTKMIKNSY